MLNYECRKILKIINKLNRNNNQITFFSIVNSFPSKKQGKWALKLKSILVYLHKTEYLNYLYADNTFYNISLTYKGLAYSSFRFEECKEFIFKSVTIPILVSLITSILTTYTLQWLQEWM